MPEQTMNDETTGGPAARSSVVGTLRTEEGRASVRMEDRFATDVEDLWAAVTQPRRLARWLAEVQGEPRIGATLHARFTSGWEGPLRIEVCEPPFRLVVTAGAGEDDETTMEAVLTPDGDGTRLVVEERGLPIGHVAGHGAGWHAHVEDLRAHLAGRPTSVWADRWAELTPEYEQRAARLT
jgi:uncharacterized protein YndB with AHSA1/START domain